MHQLGISFTSSATVFPGHKVWNIMRGALNSDNLNKDSLHKKFNNQIQYTVYNIWLMQNNGGN